MTTRFRTFTSILLSTLISLPAMAMARDAWACTPTTAPDDVQLFELISKSETRADDVTGYVANHRVSASATNSECLTAIALTIRLHRDDLFNPLYAALKNPDVDALQINADGPRYSIYSETLRHGTLALIRELKDLGPRTFTKIETPPEDSLIAEPDGDSYSFGVTEIQIASLNNTVDVIKALISEKSDVNAVDSKGQTALMLASMNNRADVVKALLNGGAQLDSVDAAGGSALGYAVKYQSDLSVIDLLLESNANVNADLNTLMKSTEAWINAGRKSADYLAVLQKLIDRKVNINTVTTSIMSPYNVNALFYVLNYVPDAVANEAATRLLKNGADDKIACKGIIIEDGTTPLMSAAGNSWITVDTLRLLLGGANLEIANGVGTTALIASTFDFSANGVAKMETLIKAGAKVSALDMWKETALHRSATNSYLLTKENLQYWVAEIKLLIAAGADKNLKDEDGRTPLEVAEWYHAPAQVIDLLSAP